MVSELERLVSLDVRACLALTDACLVHLAPLKRLAALDASRCYGITNDGILVLVSNGLPPCNSARVLGAEHVSNPE